MIETGGFPSMRPCFEAIKSGDQGCDGTDDVLECYKGLGSTRFYRNKVFKL